MIFKLKKEGDQCADSERGPFYRSVGAQRERERVGFGNIISGPPLQIHRDCSLPWPSELFVMRGRHVSMLNKDQKM